MTGRTQEPTSTAHTEWVRDLIDAKRTVRQWKISVDQYGVPEGAMVTPSLTAEQTEALRMFHAATLNYQTEASTWQKQLKGRTVDPTGHALANADRYRNGNGTTENDNLSLWNLPLWAVDSSDDFVPPTEKIRLSNLHEWEMESITRTRQTQTVEGNTETEREELRVFLPPAACSAVYRHINKAMKDLGLTAQAKEPEVHATSPTGEIEFVD